MEYRVKHKKIQKEIELLKCIRDTKRELIVANRNFEVAEEDLIDYYSYQIKANKAKLNYLIKQVKQKGIAIDMVNSLELGINRIKVI